jgi:hypothetical protein
MGTAQTAKAPALADDLERILRKQPAAPDAQGRA